MSQVQTMIYAIANGCTKATFSLSLTNDKLEVFDLQWRIAQVPHKFQPYAFVEYLYLL